MADAKREAGSHNKSQKPAGTLWIEDEIVQSMIILTSPPSVKVFFHSILFYSPFSVEENVTAPSFEVTVGQATLAPS